MASKRTRQTIPTPLAGLALGIGSLGLCLEQRLSTNGATQWVTAAIASLLLLLLVAKYWRSSALFKADVAHPIIGSVMPTFAMATMVISKTIASFSPLLGSSVWALAVILHLALLFVWLRFRIKQFKLSQMVPSWFIPPVGIIVAAVTSPGGQLDSIAQGLLTFGLYAFALMLPVMLYRLIFLPEIADPAKPTIAVMAAPASLSLTGYLNIVSEPSLPVVGLLLGLALLMTAMIYLALFSLLRLPFNPGFSSLTFPLVIGATALYQCADLANLMNIGGGGLLYQLADAELLVATLVVVYVSVRYLLTLLPKPKKESEPSLQL